MGKDKELCRRLRQCIPLRIEAMIKPEGRWSGKRITRGIIVYHFVNSRNMYYKTIPVEIVDEIHVIICRTEIRLETL